MHGTTFLESKRFMIIVTLFLGFLHKVAQVFIQDILKTLIYLKFYSVVTRPQLFECCDIFVSVIMDVEDFHFDPQIRSQSPILTLTWVRFIGRAYVINPICRSVCWFVPLSLNISRTVQYFFLICCVKLEYYEGTKTTEPDF